MEFVLKDILDNWASLYANHPALRTAISFLHVGGLLIAGGCAISADRATLRVFRRHTADRQTQLRFLQGTHMIVLAGLSAIVVSGILLFAADADSFLYSKMFWLKIGLFVTLLINGAVLLRAEYHVEHGDENRWNRLAFTSALSIALWMVTTLVGAALPNYN